MASNIQLTYSILISYFCYQYIPATVARSVGSKYTSKERNPELQSTKNQGFARIEHPEDIEIYEGLSRESLERYARLWDKELHETSIEENGLSGLLAQESKRDYTKRSFTDEGRKDGSENSQAKDHTPMRKGGMTFWRGRDVQVLKGGTGAWRGRREAILHLKDAPTSHHIFILSNKRKSSSVVGTKISAGNNSTSRQEHLHGRDCCKASVCAKCDRDVFAVVLRRNRKIFSSLGSKTSPSDDANGKRENLREILCCQQTSVDLDPEDRETNLPKGGITAWRGKDNVKVTDIGDHGQSDTKRIQSDMKILSLGLIDVDGTENNEDREGYSHQ